jgi:hypothetical protein
MRATLALATSAVLAAVPVRAVGGPKPTEEEVRAAGSTLVLAFDHNESSYLRGVLAARVTLVNLAFDDVACNKAFGRGKKRTVTKKQHAKLATCLLGARWRPSSTQAPVATLIGGMWRLVTVDPEIGGAQTEVTLRAAKDGALKIERVERVDPQGPEGAVGGVEGGEWGSDGGVLGGPLGSAVPPPPPPPPPPPASNVSPTVLESRRLTGSKLIEPDDASKQEIAKSGKAKIVAAFKLCVDTRGAVSSVRRLKSSGFLAYDTKLERAMKTWTYAPFKVDGNPAPVCTAITFVYTQT